MDPRNSPAMRRKLPIATVELFGKFVRKHKENLDYFSVSTEILGHIECAVIMDPNVLSSHCN